MSMGIYLPNMELPTSCRSCRFAGLGGRRCELNVCMFTGESQPTLSQERMSTCPLVPVPPHGRLIDADANIAVMMRVLNAPYTDHGIIETAMIKACIKMFEEAPTVIEAEEGK